MVCEDLSVCCTGPACSGSADGAPGSVWISWNAQREASDFQLFTGLKDRLRPCPSAPPFLPNHYSAFCLRKENSYFCIRPVSFFLCATQSEGTNHSVPTKKTDRQIAGQDTKRTDQHCVTAQFWSVLSRVDRKCFYSNIWLEWESNPWPVSPLHSSQRTFFILFLIRKERKVS